MTSRLLTPPRLAPQERREEACTLWERFVLTLSTSGQTSTDPVTMLTGPGRGYRLGVKNVGKALINDLRLVDASAKVHSVPGVARARPGGQETCIRCRPTCPT